MTFSTAEDQERVRHGTPRSGWTGFVAFAGTMLILLGSFHAIAGLVALFQDDYFLVTKRGLLLEADYTAWGWMHLIGGAVAVAAGFALFMGLTWARVVAVAVAMLSAILNLGFMSAYPLWSVTMIALDILVIYAVTAHGGEVLD